MYSYNLQALHVLRLPKFHRPCIHIIHTDGLLTFVTCICNLNIDSLAIPNADKGDTIHVHLMLTSIPCPTGRNLITPTSRSSNPAARP